MPVTEPTSKQREDADEATRKHIPRAAERIARDVPASLSPTDREAWIRERTGTAAETLIGQLSTRMTSGVIGAVFMAVLTVPYVLLARDGFTSAGGFFLRIILPGLVYMPLLWVCVDLTLSAPNSKQSMQLRNEQRDWVNEEIAASALADSEKRLGEASAE